MFNGFDGKLQMMREFSMVNTWKTQFKGEDSWEENQAQGSR